jgi:hypothetical protein
VAELLSEWQRATMKSLQLPGSEGTEEVPAEDTDRVANRVRNAFANPVQKINRKVKTKHKMLRLDIEKVIKATVHMEAKRTHMAVNALNRWKKKAVGEDAAAVDSSEGGQRPTKKKIMIQMKKSTLLKKVENRRLSNIQFEKIEAMYIKQEKQQPLSWKEFFSLLVNDESGVGKHFQRVIMFTILLSLVLQLVVDSPELTPYGEGSPACMEAMDSPCSDLKTLVHDLNNNSRPVQVPAGSTRVQQSLPFLLSSPVDCNGLLLLFSVHIIFVF